MNTIQRAVEAAAHHVEEYSLAPDEARLTLPSVTVEHQVQAVIMAYHLGQNRPSDPRQPRKIYFPFLEVRVSLPELEPSVKPIDPDDFGIILPEGEYIGDLGDLMRFDMDTYTAALTRYESLLSRVVDEGWLLKVVRSAEERETAMGLSETLSDISERALAPYYEVSMRALRNWMSECGYPFRAP